MLSLAYRFGAWPEPVLNPLDPAALCGAPFLQDAPRCLTRHSPQSFLNPVAAILGEAEAGAKASCAERRPREMGGT